VTTLDNRCSPSRPRIVVMEIPAALPVALFGKARTMKAFVLKQVVEHICLFGLVKDISRIAMCALAAYWLLDSIRQLLHH